METLNSKNLVDLWEPKDNLGKLHIGYGVCLDPSTFSIYGAQGDAPLSSLIDSIVNRRWKQRKDMELSMLPSS
jgi:hypothetical protein